MRALTLLLLVALAPPLAPSAASAQAARARPRRGGVDGLDMSIDGRLQVTRGGTLRWNVVAYEVRGLSELRPAAGATLHVATSIDQTADALTVQTDAGGRASVAVPVPIDAEDRIAVVLRLVNEAGIQRRYDLTVQVAPREAIEIFTARERVSPGGTLRAFGRLRHAETGRPLPGEVVRLTLRDAEGRPLDAPRERSVDEAGLFAHRFDVPDDYRGALVVEARTADDAHPVVARAGSAATEPSPPPVLVAVAAAEALVAPGAAVPLTVVVRTPNGRPLEGTTVTLDGARREDPSRRAVTDARGRAQLTWPAPTLPRGTRDVTVRVTATREGYGQGQGVARLRVAADGHAMSFAVEAGSLSPLGGHVFVRLVGAAGRPAGAGIEVEATGPRLAPGGVRATTDASGVAVLDVQVPRPADPSADRCGGETATAIVLRAATPRPLELRGCLPLDPDAALRVRAASPIVEAGGELELRVDRAPGVARSPVAVSLMAGAHAVAQRTVPPGESTARITIPADVTGRLHVRARPLLGAERQPVRGGVATVWSVAARPQRVDVTLAADGRAGLAFRGPAARSVVVVAAPIDEARALVARLEPAARGPLVDLRTPVAEASTDLIRGALAAITRADSAAPAVLRSGRAVPVPAPQNPTAEGLLRDPWRSRNRFVTGRLALILRALETTVANALPDRLEDVAVQSGARYRFNAQVLESVAHGGGLGGEGATGLGGDPLTIEQLRRFDPQINYDNVARRITRERLFRLILALRSFVGQRGFDLPWSRLGDPGEWMRQLQGHAVPGGAPIGRRDLVDGWGRPFALRPARGGRSRFRFVDPLGAWELVSAGPDGRFGSGDDAWDPTARVLRAGTPYAEAVGEDLLVARLQGVELGRATVQLLQGRVPRAAAGFVPPQPTDAVNAQVNRWMQLPSILDDDGDALALRRPAHPGDGAGGDVSRFAEGTEGAVALALDEEPRTWGAVAFAAADDGGAGVGLGSTLAGSPWIVEGELPERLRTGEEVGLELIVTNVTEEPIAARLVAEGEGVTVRAPDELSVGAGVARPLALTLVADRSPGAGRLRLSFLRGDEALRTIDAPLARVTGDHPLRLRAAGLARGRPWRLSFAVPDDARRAAGRVVLLAPSALAADPDLEDMRERDPALVAFSDALASRASEPDLWSRLLRQQGPNGIVDGVDPAVSTACAAVAWAGADPDDEAARRALSRLRGSASSLGPFRVDDPEQLGRAAAVLAALATAGVPRVGDASTRRGDPLASLASQLRVELRRAIRVHPEEPSLLARAAGALLLADPQDAYGLAMLERAGAHLTSTSDGGARVRPSERRVGRIEALSATAALAVAAQQAGDEALSERLARGALARDHVALRAGGEALFWMLSSGAFGVLGADARTAEVTIDGRSSEVELTGGRAVLPLPVGAGDHEVRVEADEGGAFVRVEAAMERPFRARDGGPFTLSLDGDVGDTATGAAMELTLTARREVGPVVVDLSLPSGAVLDLPLRRALARAEGVERAEVREPGFLRVWLSPMADGVSRTIPLPLRWAVHGTLRGLGVVAYPMGEPEAMSALAPRRLEVESGALSQPSRTP